MSRRQRFIFTLPSQDDDSSLPVDPDNASVYSSHYSYPETVWSQILSPEAEVLTPYFIYQYPFINVPSEQVLSPSDFFDPPLIPGDVSGCDGISNYNDGYSDIYNVANECANHITPYGDQFTFEDYSTHGIPPATEISENLPQETYNAYPIVTNYGAVTILLRHLVRIDISPAKAVYITNHPAAAVAAVNGTGDQSCIIHPNGKVLHNGHEIHMETLNRKAKICKRGIVFTSKTHCLSYLVDASGTKTTAEKFPKLNHDFSLDVFYNDAMAQNNAEECYRMVSESIYKSYRNGDEVWFIGGYRIKQDQRGDVKVTRNGTRFVMRSSPTSGQVSVKTFLAEINIGRYSHNYFLVRKGEKQVSASVKGFSVQNGTQKAGFNSYGRLALF